MTRSILAAHLALALAGFSTSHAVNIFKADNTSNLDTTGSWVGDIAPTSADIATWDSTVTTANTSALNVNSTWGGIKIGTATGNPGGPVGITINTGRTLTLLAGGSIDLSEATVDLTVGGPSGFLRLGTTGATNTWTIPAGRSLTINSNISTGGGTVTLNLSGAGNTFFNNAVTNGVSPLNVFNGGTGSALTFGGTATSNLTSLSAGSAGRVIINGPTVNVSGLSTYGSSTSGNSTFELQSGAATFTGTIRTSTGDGTLIKLSGGNFTASSVQLQRTANFTAFPAAASATSGFLVTAGIATITGNLDIGTSNSSASSLVSGGSLTVNGGTRIANNASATGRYSLLQVSGGSFTSTDTVQGIVLSANATNATNSALLLTGGTTTAEVINFGLTTTATNSTGTLVLNSPSASLYVGSGGITQGPAAGAYTSTINLSAGTLGAKADWTSQLPMNLAAGNVTIKAADANDAPHQINLAGNLGGIGGLTKSGTGTLTLTGLNNYTGETLVNAGELQVNGSLTASATTVNAGGILGGTGSVAGITLNPGGAISAGSSADDFGAASLLWNGETGAAAGQMKFALSAIDNTSDRLTLGGALVKGTGTGFAFDFQNTGAESNVYTLLTFSTQTGFIGSDFSYANLAKGLSGSFDLQSNALVFTVVPEPATTGFLIAGIGSLLALRRGRRENRA